MLELISLMCIYLSVIYLSVGFVFLNYGLIIAFKKIIKSMENEKVKMKKQRKWKAIAWVGIIIFNLVAIICFLIKIELILNNDVEKITENKVLQYLLIYILLTLACIILFWKYKSRKDVRKDVINYIKKNTKSYGLVVLITFIAVVLINIIFIGLMSRLGFQLDAHRLNFFDVLFTVIVLEILFKFTRNKDTANLKERAEWRMYYLANDMITNFERIFINDDVNDSNQVFVEERDSRNDGNRFNIRDVQGWNSIIDLKNKLGQHRRFKKSALLSRTLREGRESVDEIIDKYSGVLNDSMVKDIHDLQRKLNEYTFSKNEKFQNYNMELLEEYIKKIEELLKCIQQPLIKRYENLKWQEGVYLRKATHNLRRKRVAKGYTIEEFCDTLISEKLISGEGDFEIKYRLFEEGIGGLNQEQVQRIWNLLESIDNNN